MEYSLHFSRGKDCLVALHGVSQGAQGVAEVQGILDVCRVLESAQESGKEGIAGAVLVDHIEGELPSSVEFILKDRKTAPGPVTQALHFPVSEQNYLAAKLSLISAEQLLVMALIAKQFLRDVPVGDQNIHPGQSSTIEVGGFTGFPQGLAIVDIKAGTATRLFGRFQESQGRLLAAGIKGGEDAIRICVVRPSYGLSPVEIQGGCQAGRAAPAVVQMHCPARSDAELDEYHPNLFVSYQLNLGDIHAAAGSQFACQVTQLVIRQTGEKEAMFAKRSEVSGDIELGTAGINIKGTGSAEPLELWRRKPQHDLAKGHQIRWHAGPLDVVMDPSRLA